MDGQRDPGKKKKMGDRCNVLNGLEKTQVVVASTAFGMGIDKADVRFVINYSIPQRLASLSQSGVLIDFCSV